MASAWEEISRPRGSPDFADGSGHRAYFFEDSREKQRRLFQLCLDGLQGSCFVLYLAGKQGTKGIRLSMKDDGIDVGAFEREKKLKIADSEEFYLNSARIPTFKSVEALLEQLKKIRDETKESGSDLLLVISETDQIVRKGFIKNYMEFERVASELAAGRGVVFICAYDTRELEAARVSADSISRLHEKSLN